MILIPDAKEKIFYAVLSGFILFFIFASFKFVTRYENINHKKDWPSRKEHLSRQDTDLIRDWMTFGYINKIYDLPPNYLKEILGITNKKYPNMIVDEQNLEHVKSAVSDFDNNNIENR